MDATLRQTQFTPHGLYEPIAEPLARVEQVLRAELQHPHPGVDRLVRHAFRLGGKRLRPAMLLLAAQAVGRVTDEHITLAAVVEMVHTATLLHDDVLDGADQRRHLPTANSKFGNQASILAGDFLFTHAFYLASTLDTTYACQAIGRATNQVCEGEMLQVATQGDLELSEADYFRIIDAKTAALTACSSLLGAYYAGGNEQLVESLERYGRHLGRAFQMADDLLDLLGDASTVGKSLGTDLAQRKLTLPWIRLRDQATPAERQRLFALWNSPAANDHQALLTALADSHALDDARRTAEHEALQARDMLAGLADSPAAGVLQGLTEYVVRRAR